MSLNALHPSHDLALVTAVSRLDVFERRLMASPCVQRGGLPVMAYFNCTSAAHAFNAAMDSQPASRWLVWLHQDVFLPLGWETQFAQAIEEAERKFHQVSVVGVYGVRGEGAQAVRAGHVLDRGVELTEPAALPCEVDSLDELLFAVRVDSGLRLDPDLGFDFYATDLVLSAQAKGLTSVVVDAFCEHWSDTPASGAVPAATLSRIAASACVFESKWQSRLPLTTPCFDIRKTGDVAQFMNAHFVATP
jgi:hypothetical protein